MLNSQRLDTDQRSALQPDIPHRKGLRLHFAVVCVCFYNFWDFAFTSRCQTDASSNCNLSYDRIVHKPLCCSRLQRCVIEWVNYFHSVRIWAATAVNEVTNQPVDIPIVRQVCLA